MKYIKHAAGVAAFISLGLAFTAFLAVVFGVVAVAAVGSFLVVFPLVLLTAPAVKRAAKSINAKLREELKAFKV